MSVCLNTHNEPKLILFAVIIPFDNDLSYNILNYALLNYIRN